MTVFLIIVAVLVVIVALILSLTATIYVSYDKQWRTTIQVLFIKKDIVLSEMLSFLLFPKETAEEKQLENKANKKNNDAIKESKKQPNATNANDKNSAEIKKEKPNYFKQVYEQDGIVGIMSVFSNMFESLSAGINKFFKVFHIHELYVKMIIGGRDAADISETYGMISSVYYPLIGIVRNGMKIDEFQEIFFADFIAPKSEYEFNLVASISVRNLLQIAIKAGKTFLINFIKNK